MMKRIYLTPIFIGMVLIFNLQGQENLNTQLKERLEGKQNFLDIMREVEIFYSGQSDEIRRNGGDGVPKWKAWQRYNWYMGRNLGENGKFVNRSELINNAIKNNPRPSYSKDATAGDWKQIGLDQSSYSKDSVVAYANGVGRVDRIAFHPTDSTTFYIGTPQSGLWKTTDSGVTWNCMTDHLPNLGISGVFVHKNNPNWVFILTGTGDTYTDYLNFKGLNSPSLGVMRSINAGTVWTEMTPLPVTPGLESYVGYDLVQSPLSANIMIAATSDGIFKTEDLGGTWTKVKSGLHHDLHFKQVGTDILYSTSPSGIFYSTDRGSTWNTSTFDIPPSPLTKRIAIDASAQSDGWIYAICGAATGNGSFAGFYRSLDGGVSFTRQATSPNILGGLLNGGDNRDQGAYDLCIAADPEWAGGVVTGGINMWKTFTGGSFWNIISHWIEDYDTDTAYVHADHHALAYNPLDNKLYSCNDGGIAVSTDDGSTWTDLSKGLFISQFYHLSKPNISAYRFAGGLQDNGLKMRARGSTDFVHMHGADGFSTSFTPHNPNIFYSTVNEFFTRINYEDGSKSNTTNFQSFFPHVLAHRVDTNIVFVGSTNNYKSMNQGANWTNTGGAGNWGLAIAPSDPTKMYSAGAASIFNPNGDVFYSSNSGDSWTNISNNPGFPPGTSYSTITDIAVNPSNPNEVYVSVGGFIDGSKVYYSSDYGQTWSNRSYNLPNVVVHSIAVIDDRMYAGTDISLYRRMFGSGNWVDVGDNLPRVPITEILPDPLNGNITIATFGRGVWQQTYCNLSLFLTENLEGNLDFSSDLFIASTSTIPGIDRDSIKFSSGGFIQLFPGFKVKEGSYFKTEKTGCINGTAPFTDNKSDVKIRRY